MKNPLTLTALTAFAASKPTDEVYDYTEPGRCFIAQFFESLGYDDALCDDRAVDIIRNRGQGLATSFKIPCAFNVAVMPIAGSFSNNVRFGDALKRLQELA